MTNAASEPPIEDEGESQGKDLTTHDPAGDSQDPERALDSYLVRFKKAVLILRGKDVKYLRVEDPSRILENKRLRQANWFRGIYAPVLLALMCVQVAFADYFFWRLASERDWNLDRSVVIAFLSSVVVEVIGAVLVVTRAIFNDPSAPSAGPEN